MGSHGLAWALGLGHFDQDENFQKAMAEAMQQAVWDVGIITQVDVEGLSQAVSAH